MSSTLIQSLGLTTIADVDANQPLMCDRPASSSVLQAPLDDDQVAFDGGARKVDDERIDGAAAVLVAPPHGHPARGMALPHHT